MLFNFTIYYKLYEIYKDNELKILFLIIKKRDYKVDKKIFKLNSRIKPHQMN